MTQLSPEAIDHTCEKCGKQFTCQDEIGDNYKNYCSDCYKRMISERHSDPEDEEYYLAYGDD